jgi:hypothetical protein
MCDKYNVHWQFSFFKRVVGLRHNGEGTLYGSTMSPDWEPQVVFLGLPIPPLTDREEPPRSGSGHQNLGRRLMQPSALRFEREWFVQKIALAQRLTPGILMRRVVMWLS